MLPRSSLSPPCCAWGWACKEEQQGIECPQERQGCLAVLADAPYLRGGRHGAGRLPTAQAVLGCRSRRQNQTRSNGLLELLGAVNSAIECRDTTAQHNARQSKALRCTGAQHSRLE